MAQVNHFHFDLPTILTFSTPSRESKLISSPTLNFSLSASFIGNSFVTEKSFLLKVVFHFFRFHSAFDHRIPIIIASYPSFSVVLNQTTFITGISSRVIGINLSHFTILVISNFLAKIQAILKMIIN
jgi:hypothetical protein